MNDSSGTVSRVLSFGIIYATLFCVLIVMGVCVGIIPMTILLFYACASAITFCMYAVDKSAAIGNRRRTPEKSLHLFAMIGGWPGAIAAQCLLRHKSRKLNFQVLFWVCVLLNCGIFGWIFLDTALEFFRSSSGI